jgi:hypothetical protein
MKLRSSQPVHRRSIAFSLVELMVAIGLGVLLIGSLLGLYVSGLISFVAMGNYQNLDVKSYYTLDVLSREIRNSSTLLSYTNGSSFTLSNAYARNGAGQINVVTYNSTARTVTLQRTGQPLMTNLTECDAWSFRLYTRAPDTNSFSTNIFFIGATNAADCKLVQMSWKCSRTIMGSKLNTESVQTAQIVLRNKTVQ